MARLQNGENPRNVDLNTIDLWVQVHDLRISFMSEKILKGIGNYVGKFVDCCPNNFTGGWRDYMRIRVSIDLRVSLKRRMKIKMARDKWFWVNFKYESIPTFCFICGIFGHSEKFCSKLFEVPEGDIIRPYGSWMRAQFRNQIKPIGAKWLRSGTSDHSSSSTTEMHGIHMEKDDANQDPNNSPIITEVIRQGEIIGISKFQTLNSRAGSEFSNKIITNSQTNSQTITEQLHKRDTSVIETKTRRTGTGLDDEKPEQGRNNGI